MQYIALFLLPSMDLLWALSILRSEIATVQIILLPVTVEKITQCSPSVLFFIFHPCSKDWLCKLHCSMCPLLDCVSDVVQILEKSGKSWNLK